MPERDVPGLSASDLGRRRRAARPRGVARRRPALGRPPVGPPEQQAEHDQRDGDERDRSPSFSSMVSSNSRADGGGRDRRQHQQPRQPAVGWSPARWRWTTAAHAVAGVDREVLAEVGDDRDSVPMCSATSKAFSDARCRRSRPSRTATARGCRWPLEEIGRNSVRPWTMPRTMAWRSARRRVGSAGPWWTARCAAARVGAGRSGGRRPAPARSVARNVGRAVEVGHLDVGGAEGLGHVGVAAAPAGRSCSRGERRGPLVQVAQRRSWR